MLRQELTDLNCLKIFSQQNFIILFNFAVNVSTTQERFELPFFFRKERFTIKLLSITAHL